MKLSTQVQIFALIQTFCRNDTAILNRQLVQEIKFHPAIDYPAAIMKNRSTWRLRRLIIRFLYEYGWFRIQSLTLMQTVLVWFLILWLKKKWPKANWEEKHWFHLTWSGNSPTLGTKQRPWRNPVCLVCFLMQTSITSWGWFHPQWTGPYVNQENAQQACL